MDGFWEEDLQCYNEINLFACWNDMDESSSQQIEETPNSIHNDTSAATTGNLYEFPRIEDEGEMLPMYLELPASNPVATPEQSLEHQKPGSRADYSKSPLIFDFKKIEDKDSGWVQSHIEEIFSSLVDTLFENKELVVKLKIRKTRACQRFDPLTNFIRNTTQYSTRLLIFPGKSAVQAWRFAVLLRVLSLILEALTEKKVTTKRDIYYKDVNLFRKQSVVDTIVDDVAYTFGVEREKLNVVAAAKGLVCGNMKIWFKSGDAIECWKDKEGLLIPSAKLIDRIDILNAEWVLVIEKEATFRALATNGFWDKCTAGKGILITGKGYPDISTRQFLRLLEKSCSLLSHKDHSSPPGTKIYAVVDHDPHGLYIASVYKFGSIALAHENHKLIVNRIELLGIKNEDLDMSRDQTIQSIEAGILSLTIADRKKAVQMLGKLHIWSQEEWRSELQRMLFMNVKAEIQAMDVVDRGGLEFYLNRKLVTACSG